jgi:hypothetical protein
MGRRVEKAENTLEMQVLKICQILYQNHNYINI